MLRAYSIQAVRDAEAAIVAEADTDELMLLAAAGVSDTAVEMIANAGQEVPGSVALALIGGGDNGGDGLYAAANLARAHIETIAVILHEHPHERALAAAREAGVQIWTPELTDSPTRIAREIVEVARGAGLWIDALTGTGCTDRLRRPLRDVVRALDVERETSPDEPIVIAVDVPSGLGGDDGAIAGPHLRAHVTVTMGERKAASLLAPAAYAYGRVRTVELTTDTLDLGYLGEPLVAMLEAADVGDLLFVPGPTDHKYTRGVVQVIAGSKDYPMTGVMCATAAARAGAGMVRYEGPPEASLALVSRLPEAVPGLGRHQSLVIGPGLSIAASSSASARKARNHYLEQVRQARTQHIPVVIDAGALELVPQLIDEAGGRRGPRLGELTVLTPHAGEAARLLTALGVGSRSGGITRDEVEAQPARWADELTARTGATIVLKGGQTLTSGVRGPLYACNQAPGWAGTAGSGDVLAGTIGALLAARNAIAIAEGRELGGSEVTVTAAAGVWLHGRAARIAARCEDAADDPRWLDLPELPARAGGRPRRRPEPEVSVVGQPIIASDIVTTLPAAFAQALGAAQ